MEPNGPNWTSLIITIQMTQKPSKTWRLLSNILRIKSISFKPKLMKSIQRSMRLRLPSRERPMKLKPNRNKLNLLRRKKQINKLLPTVKNILPSSKDNSISSNQESLLRTLVRNKSMIYRQTLRDSMVKLLQ